MVTLSCALFLCARLSNNMRNMLVYLKLFIFYKEEKGGGGWGWGTGTEIYVSPIINSLTIWHYPPVSSIQCVDITVFFPSFF